MQLHELRAKILAGVDLALPDYQLKAHIHAMFIEFEEAFESPEEEAAELEISTAVEDVKAKRRGRKGAVPQTVPQTSGALPGPADPGAQLASDGTPLGTAVPVGGTGNGAPTSDGMPPADGVNPDTTSGTGAPAPTGPGTGMMGGPTASVGTPIVASPAAGGLPDQPLPPAGQATATGPGQAATGDAGVPVTHFYTHSTGNPFDTAAYPQASVHTVDGSILHTFGQDRPGVPPAGESPDWVLYTGPVV